MTSTRLSDQSANNITQRVEFEALFEAYWIPICQTLYRLLGDWDEAQDLALETFLQLASRPPSENRNLGGWLYRVATHLGFNFLRSYKRRRKYETQAAQESLLNQAGPNPEIEVEHKQEKQQVRLVLQTMKPRSARLLLMRYSGLSYTEIAEALDIAAGSVGTLLARAEKEFERAFHEE